MTLISPVDYEIIVRMGVFSSKDVLIPGTSYDEVIKVARIEHKKIENLTKRQPYVRSTYFRKDKIFVSLFWTHLMQKNLKIRTKRLKLYKAAIDLMRNSHHSPDTVYSKDNLNTILHRFHGITRDGVAFSVNVKQDKRSGRKDFMSVYPKK